MAPKETTSEKEGSKNYRHFTHHNCEYYPCHPIKEGEELNCLFCYCPLNHLSDCGGNYTLTKEGVKDCSKCLLPHRNYDYVIERLKRALKTGL